MPTIGSLHGTYWRARANAPPPVLASRPMSYTRYQRVMVFGALFGGLQPIWEQIVWYGRLARRLWRWRDHRRLETWIARLETLDPEQHLVLERVVDALTGPFWAEAHAAVRACATTPKFHQPEQWVAYGRLLKANMGQAQNVFRHLRALDTIRTIRDETPARLSNPEAHLVIELAYQGLAATGRAGRRLIKH